MRKLPIRLLIKTATILSSPLLLILAYFVISAKISLMDFFIGYIFALTASLFFIYPLIKSIISLTNYVKDLSQDKRPKSPDLGFISMIAHLSESLSKLQRIWDSKRNQMEQIITEREILVDTLPDILIMTNDDKLIVRTNRAARAVFGQNLANCHLRKILPNQTLLNTVTAVIDDLKGREVEFRLEEPVFRDFLAIIERFPIPSKGGMSIIITINDITELKSVEQMRADFVSNASHEIRTPLTTISGFIETLLGPAKDDESVREEFLKLMAEQATRMQQLINDLLSLSKIEMNAHSVPMDKVNLSEIIKSTANQLTHRAIIKKMNIILKIRSNLPAVKGDNNELSQIIYNLLGNAVKYGYNETDIIVTADITSDLPRDQNMRNLSRVVYVSIEDVGEGIDKKHLSRLTERFYRVDSARTREIGGTGLGLAIVKSIITRHRGAITIESTIGKGSKFSVFIPIYK